MKYDIVGFSYTRQLNVSAFPSSMSDLFQLIVPNTNEDVIVQIKRQSDRVIIQTVTAKIFSLLLSAATKRLLLRKQWRSDVMEEEINGTQAPCVENSEA